MSKILVIDDSITQGAIIVQLLLEYDHQVEIETCGEKGLARALQQDFDLIISDLNLPDLNGLEICREYKASGHTTPILLISSQDQLNQLTPENSAGVDYYCTKDRLALECRVQTILLRQRHHRLSNRG